MLRKQNEIIDIIMFLGDFQLTGQNLPLTCLHPNTLFDPIFLTTYHPISVHVFRAELFERVAYTCFYFLSSKFLLNPL